MQTASHRASSRGRARTAPQGTSLCRVHAAIGRCSRRPHHSQFNHSQLRAANSEAGTTSCPLTSTVETIGDCIQWGSCVSTRSKLKAALEEAITSIHTGMDRPFEPELAIVFASCSYGRDLEKLVTMLRAQCPTLKYIFGSTAYAVAGSTNTYPVEVEGLPGVSLALGRLPGVRISLVHTLRSSLPSEDASPEEWADLVGVTLASASSRPGSPLPTLPDSDAEQQQPDQQQEQQGKQQEEGADPPSSSGSSSAADKGLSASGGVEAVGDASTGNERSSDSSSSSSSSGSSSSKRGQWRSLADPEPEPSPSSSASNNGTSSSSSNGTGSDSKQGSSTQSKPPPQTKQRITVSRTPVGGGRSPLLEGDPPVSFLLSVDPRFSQARQLMAGLDFAFPTSSKLGSVLSAGQAERRRLMYVWSEEGGVMAGSQRNLEQRKQRQLARQQQQPEQGMEVSNSNQQQQPDADDPKQQALQEQREVERQKQRQQLLAEVEQLQAQGAPSTKAAKGVLESIFNALAALGDDGKDTAAASPSSSASSSTSGRQANSMRVASSSSSNSSKAFEDDSTDASSSSRDDSSSEKPSWWQRLFGDADSDDGEAEEEAAAAAAAEAAQEDNGVFMYGAAVLAMQGPVVLEPLVSQGYRSVDDQVWTIGAISSDGRVIASLIDPSKQGEEAEQTPLMALYQLLLTLGVDPEGAAHAEFLSALTEKLALAVARDALSPDQDITPDDFQVMRLEALDQQSGAMLVGEEVRSGYRLKLVLRDVEGVRADLVDKLLSLKRADLSAVLSASPRPRAFGALMVNDIARGIAMYGEEGTEVKLVAQYLPVPLMGLHASGEISSVRNQTSIYDVSCAVGVLRAMPEADR